MNHRVIRMQRKVTEEAATNQPEDGFLKMLANTIIICGCENKVLYKI